MILTASIFNSSWNPFCCYPSIYSNTQFVICSISIAGFMTGKCLPSQRYKNEKACEINGWCPTEKSIKPWVFVIMMIPSIPQVLSLPSVQMYFKHNSSLTWVTINIVIMKTRFIAPQTMYLCVYIAVTLSVRPTVQMSCYCNSFLTDKPILKKLYTV